MNSVKIFVQLLINFIRAIVRPVVTLALVLLILFLGYGVWMAIQNMIIADKFTGEQLMTLATQILQFVFTITASAIAFWFADRKTKPPDDGTTPTQ